jgi:hypothetical protein
VAERGGDFALAGGLETIYDFERALPNQTLDRIDKLDL